MNSKRDPEHRKTSEPVLRPGPPQIDDADFSDRPVRHPGFASAPGEGSNPTPPEIKTTASNKTRSGPRK